MTPPKFYTYAFGNIATCLVFYASTAFVGWKYFVGDGSLEFLVIMLIFSGVAAHEAKKLGAYKTAKREWDAMGGVPPKPSLFKRWPWIAHVVNFLLWGALGLALMSVLPEQPASLVLRVYVWAYVFIIGRWLWRWHKRRAGKAASATIHVSVCLALPKASPSYGQIVCALPDYCQELIARSASPSSISARHPR